VGLQLQEGADQVGGVGHQSVQQRLIGMAGGHGGQVADAHLGGALVDPVGQIGQVVDHPVLQ